MNTFDKLLKLGHASIFTDTNGEEVIGFYPNLLKKAAQNIDFDKDLKLLTDSEKKIAAFALLRFIQDARFKATEAAQDVSNTHSKPGDTEMFLDDAKTASSALQKLKEIISIINQV